MRRLFATVIAALLATGVAQAQGIGGGSISGGGPGNAGVAAKSPLVTGNCPVASGPQQIMDSGVDCTGGPGSGFMLPTAGNATSAAPPNLGLGMNVGVGQGSILLGAGGSGYVQGDSVTLTCSGCTFSTNPTVAINQQSGGVTTGLTLTNPGVLTNFPKSTNPITFTQSSTSGAGTGLTLTGNLGPIAAGFSAASLGTGGTITNGNLFIGAETPAAGLGGAENTFFGDRAGGTMAGTSTANSAFGHNACGISGTGPFTAFSANTCLGNDAGRNISNSAQNNTLAGTNAGRNVASNNNTMYGVAAGTNVSSGSNNTIIKGPGGNGATLTTGANELIISDDAATAGETGWVRIGGVLECSSSTVCTLAGKTPTHQNINYGGGVSTIPIQNATTNLGTGCFNAADGRLCSIIFSQAGTVKSLYAAAYTAPGGTDTYTVTMFKNSSSQTVTCTMTGVAGTCNDTTHSFTVAAGDGVFIRYVGSATASNNNWLYGAFEFDPS